MVVLIYKVDLCYSNVAVHVRVSGYCFANGSFGFRFIVFDLREPEFFPAVNAMNIERFFHDHRTRKDRIYFLWAVFQYAIWC